MSSKLDLRHIVCDHLATLIDYRTQERSKLDIFVFFGVPAMGSSVMIVVGIRLDGTQASVLVTALSIFAALLFNLLLITHSIISGTPAVAQRLHRRRLLKEVYANISYAILTSVLAVLFLLLFVIFELHWLHDVSSAAVYFLVMNFLLTLFLILKRVHLTLRAEFEAANSQ